MMIKNESIILRIVNGLGVFLLLAILLLPYEGKAQYTLSQGSSDPQTTNTPSVGSESFQTNLFTGSASTSVPIVVPPGTNAMQPSLALVYDTGSQNSDTFIAPGWDLAGIGHIERSTKLGPPKYTSADSYVINMSGSHDLVFVASDGYYHTKEETFLRIDYKTDFNYWLVTDKRGTQFRFGYDTNSKSEAVGRSATRRWSLDLVTDIHGNQMSVSYNNVDAAYGVVYPDTITYTQGNGLATFRTVVFNYEARPDVVTSYRYGAPVKITRRLSYIDVKMNGAIVRRYELSYADSTSSKNSLLTKVQLFGADAEPATLATGTAFPPTLYQYSTPPNNLDSPSTGAGNFNGTGGGTWTTQTALNVLIADSTADGKADLIYCKNTGTTGWYIAAVNSSGTGFDQADLVASVGCTNIASAGDFQGFGVLGLAIQDSANPTRVLIRGNGPAWDWHAPSETNPQGTIKIFFGDMDGDKKEDILYTISYSAGATQCTNLGISEACTGVWVQLTVPDPTKTSLRGQMAGPAAEWTAYTTAPIWTKLIDLNGDHKADLVQNFGSAGLKVLLSTGSGFTDSGAWLTTSPTSGLNLWRFGDFNGDGLIDAAVLDASLQKVTVHLNAGTFGANGFGSGVLWLDRTTTWSGTGVQTGDFNGDDKTDLVNYDKVLLSSGSNFEAPGSGKWTNSSASSPNLFVADFNGDGKTDLAEYYFNSSGTFTVRLSNGPPINLATTITNSNGGSITNTYQSMSISHIPPVFVNARIFDFTIPIVSSVAMNDGMGNTNTTAYTYQDGIYDLDTREFRGFSSVKVTDLTGAYRVTTFDQSSQLKGKATLIEDYDSTNKIYTKIQNTWNYSTPFTGVTFPFLDHEDTYSYDGVSTTLNKRAQTKYLYGNYGNVVQIDRLGDFSITADNRYDYIEYAPANSTAYIVSLPSHSYTKNASNATVAETWNYYDGDTSGTAIPTKGNLTKSCGWLGPSSARVCTTYGYDFYGNRTSTTDANTHTSTVAYDGTYRTFPVMQTNALGHYVISGYDGLGRLTSISDQNNVTSTYQYDALSRKTADIIPPDTAAAPTTAYIYMQTGTAPSGIRTQKRQSVGGGTLDAYTFVDGLGRTIQTKTPASDGLNQNIVNTTYNNIGLVHTVSIPYPVTIATIYSTPDTTVKKTTTLYDPIRRVKRVTNTDNTYSTFSYDKWTTTITDPNGRKKVETRDGFGRLIQVDEYTGADGRNPSIPTAAYALYATTKYTYDVLGNLKTTTDQLLNVATMDYDTLGRKISMHDPDMGDWSYRYDFVGNLIQQTDAKSQITYLTYDALNRIKTKTLTATADTQLPSNPSGLTATAFNSKQINLTWTASTDDVAVAGYKVERCQGASCSDFVEVATPSEASYRDGGLTANTTYNYRIRSVDVAGNVSSSYSNIAWAITSQTDSNSPTVPSGLTATAVSATQVNLSWTASTDNVGVDHYEVERLFNNGLYALIATPTSSSYGDNMGSNGTTYLYRVRAVDAAGNTSGYSNIDLATTVPFTDNPLVVGTTTIKAQHLTELRQAVNAVRLTAGLAASVWTDPTLAGLFIQKIHIEELRSNLTPALTALGFTAPTYTDPTLTAGSTVMKKAHVEELRQAVK